VSSGISGSKEANTHLGFVAAIQTFNHVGITSLAHCCGTPMAGSEHQNIAIVSA
jgi:hypothetical protein